jgi:hypothetical protein
MMSLVSLVTAVALTVVGARSCQASAPGSATNPRTFLQNGIQGLCANAAAVAGADGGDGTSADTSAVTLLSPQQASALQASDPAGFSALVGTNGGSVPTCPTG